MIASNDFPRLTADNHRITSAATPEYNCIAWTVHDTTRWWQPDIYWPLETDSDDYGIAVLETMLIHLGYSECESEEWEEGQEKVALYGSTLFYTHAARQLPNGKWTSKLGRSEDIEHDTPDAIAGGLYGEVVQFMRKPVTHS